MNCQMAKIVGKNRVTGCEACGSNNPDACVKDSLFQPCFTKEEIHEQFRQRLRNPQILVRDYPGVAALLWTIGAFEEEVDEKVMADMEVRKPLAAGGNNG